MGTSFKEMANEIVNINQCFKSTERAGRTRRVDEKISTFMIQTRCNYISGKKSHHHISNIYVYYTLRFYFPYLSLLAQPVNITLYGPGLDCLVFDSVPERYLHYYVRLLHT